MSRPKERINPKYLALSDSLFNKEKQIVAVVSSGFSDKDIKTPVKRLRALIREALINEERRYTWYQAGYVVYGSMKNNYAKRATQHEIEFAQISEPQLCFYEHLLSQGWTWDKQGRLYNPHESKKS